MEHNHSHSTSSKNLAVSMIINLFITIIQIIGGIFSNSLSLISDALHNFTDTFSLGLSLYANKISDKKGNERKTFGYKRAEIIAAFINTSFLIGVSLFLFKEAFGRIIHPQEVNGKLLFIAAIIAFVGNSIGAVFLYKGSEKNLNVKSAFLHIFSDALSSITVIIGGLLIIYKGWYIIDPILTFVIGIYIIIMSYGILRESLHILMQGAPEDISISEIKCAIENVEGVNNVHHIHIWSLTEEDIFFEAHVCVDEMSLQNAEKIKMKIKNILKYNYSIEHSTLEFESNECGQKLIEK